MNDQWLTIALKNKDIARYAPGEYTSYHYDGKCFIVILDNQWIGIYNMDAVDYVVVHTEEEAERSNRDYTFYEEKK